MTAFHIVFPRFARILFLAAATMPLPALAQTTLWNTTADGNWSDPTKWDNGVPGNNFSVGYKFFGKGSFVTTEIAYDYTGPSITLNSFSIIRAGPQIGQLNQDSNRLGALSETISGIYQQTGGINAVTNTLSLPVRGEYFFDGGSLSAGQLTADGTFTHTSGGATVTGLLALAHTSVSGVYTMAGDAFLTAGTEFVGE